MIIFYNFIFLWFVVSISLFPAVNLCKNVTVKTDPQTDKTKRLRLTDESFDKSWTGELVKNKLRMQLDEPILFNTIRFKTKKDFTFSKIKLKAGTSSDDKITITVVEDVSALAGEWITLGGFIVEAEFIELVLKNKTEKPKIYEIEIYKREFDVNGDGLDDIIVGAPARDVVGSPSALPGSVSIFSGAYNLLDSTTLLTQTGHENGMLFGCAVAILGDVNRDGFSDFIVGGALKEFEGIIDVGRSSLSFGNTDLDSTAYAFNGTESNEEFGTAVARLGDINNDGYLDFAIGSHKHSGGGVRQGSAYIYLGGVTVDTIPSLILNGNESDCRFGSALSGIGDVNNDGYDDFLVAAPKHDASSFDRGQVYIYLGGPTLNSTPILTLSGLQDECQFGTFGTGIGDINGDGFDDFMISSPYFDIATGDEGQTYVYFGGASLDTIPDLVIDGDQTLSFSGVNISGLGDINGDGFDDFAVGAYARDINAGGDNRGRVSVFFGSSTPDNIPDMTIDGDEDLAALGFVSMIGDINGDGFDDFKVGAYKHDANGNPGSDRGRVYVYLGGENPDNIADMTLNGLNDNGGFGGDY